MGYFSTPRAKPPICLTRFVSSCFIHPRYLRESITVGRSLAQQTVGSLPRLFFQYENGGSRFSDRLFFRLRPKQRHAQSSCRIVFPSGRLYWFRRAVVKVSPFLSSSRRSFFSTLVSAAIAKYSKHRNRHRARFLVTRKPLTSRPFSRTQVTQDTF